jgi:SAM-dependent methyltransferase
MDIMNPIPAEKLDAAIEALGSVNGGLAIDLGCGKGELLARLGDRHVRGVGVDLSYELLEEARRRAPDCEFVEGDVTTFETSQTFDIAASVGSPARLEQLASLIDQGGRVLYGEAYWRRPPPPEYLAALGAAEDDYTDHAGVIAAGERIGLRFLEAVTASIDDFDRYEARWAENGKGYAAEHADEPGVDEFLAWIRNGRRRYLELNGRETLGFGLFLFRKDGDA